MARQTSLHHRSNQTRNRHGWRCLAERKLRLRVRQYGERYLWFESISLHHPVPANRPSFPDDKNPRNSGRLETVGFLCRDGKLKAIAGGGDTVAALNEAGVAGQFTYVSAAGGAFLEWMEGKALPGVEALRAD